MAIALDAVSTDYDDGVASSVSTTHTAAGTDRVVIVFVGQADDTTDDSCTGVTYDGNAMTQAGNEARNAFDCVSSMWYLEDPPTTAGATVEATFANTVPYPTIAVLSYTGADSVTNAADTTGTSDSLAITVNVGTATSWVIAGGTIFGGDADPFTPDDTERYDLATGASSSGDIAATGGDLDPDATGNQEWSSTASVSDGWAMNGAELTQAGGTEHTQTVSESISISDSIISAAGFVSMLTESVSITDSISSASNFVSMLTESISITDHITRVYTAQRMLSESVSIADSVASVKAIVKLLTESITISDSIYRTWVAQRMLTENVSVADSILRVWIAQRMLSEDISISDSVSLVMEFIKTLSENISISDSIISAWSAVKVISESISIADSTSTTLTFIRTLTENISVVDSISVLRQLYLTENISIAANIKFRGILGRIIKGQFAEITTDDVSDTFTGHWD